MNIISKLESFQINEISDLLDELFETDNIDIRNDIVADIMIELDLNEVDYSDFRDEIEDLVVGNKINY